MDAVALGKVIHPKAFETSGSCTAALLLHFPLEDSSRLDSSPASDFLQRFSMKFEKRWSSHQLRAACPRDKKWSFINTRCRWKSITTQTLALEPSLKSEKPKSGSGGSRVWTWIRKQMVDSFSKAIKAATFSQREAAEPEWSNRPWAQTGRWRFNSHTPSPAVGFFGKWQSNNPSETRDR